VRSTRLQSRTERDVWLGREPPRSCRAASQGARPSACRVLRASLDSSRRVACICTLGAMDVPAPAHQSAFAIDKDSSGVASRCPPDWLVVVRHRLQACHARSEPAGCAAGQQRWSVSRVVAGGQGGATAHSAGVRGRRIIWGAVIGRRRLLLHQPPSLVWRRMVSSAFRDTRPAGLPWQPPRSKMLRRPRQPSAAKDSQQPLRPQGAEGEVTV
jgi:hypothetical protein